MKPLKNMTTLELTNELEILQAGVVEKIKRIAAILVELDRRGVRHPLMRQGTFSWYKELANGLIDPEALLSVRPSGAPVKLLLKMPIVRQREYTVTQVPIRIAQWNDRNEVQIFDRAFHQLTDAQLAIAFDEKGEQRSDRAQKLRLTKEGPRRHVSKTKSRLIADVKRRELIIGAERFTLRELAKALDDLGLKVVPK